MSVRRMTGLAVCVLIGHVWPEYLSGLAPLRRCTRCGEDDEEKGREL